MSHGLTRNHFDITRVSEGGWKWRISALQGLLHTSPPVAQWLPWHWVDMHGTGVPKPIQSGTWWQKSKTLGRIISQPGKQISFPPPQRTRGKQTYPQVVFSRWGRIKGSLICLLVFFARQRDDGIIGCYWCICHVNNTETLEPERQSPKIL